MISAVRISEKQQCQLSQTNCASASTADFGGKFFGYKKLNMRFLSRREDAMKQVGRVCCDTRRSITSVVAVVTGCRDTEMQLP